MDHAKQELLGLPCTVLVELDTQCLNVAGLCQTLLVVNQMLRNICQSSARAAARIADPNQTAGIAGRSGKR